MRTGLAGSAGCNKGLLGIIAGVTPKLFVVNFQVRHRPARLARPAISLQDLQP
ncbi:MAG: hypothetical protein WBP65_04170 [Candidatus Sulfotelmatobacter sp.]|jgi:hypothetical protein